MHDQTHKAPLCPNLIHSQLQLALSCPPYFQSSHWRMQLLDGPTLPRLSISQVSTVLKARMRSPTTPTPSRRSSPAPFTHPQPRNQSQHPVLTVETMATTRPNSNKRPLTTDTNNGIDTDVVQSSSRPGPAKYPRKRVSVACEACRLRKTRCDAAKPKCRFYSNAGIECFYRQTNSEPLL